VARSQLAAESTKATVEGGSDTPVNVVEGRTTPSPGSTTPIAPQPQPAAQLPRRFHGTVTLDATRVGRDAGRVAEEVIAHLTGLINAKVTVTLEIEASIPSGASDHVVRTVTENSRTLKFSSHGFENE
jgi:hypothetical protein